MEGNKKPLQSNTEKEYEDALATSDPTKMSKEELQNLAKNAVKKFKALS